MTRTLIVLTVAACSAVYGETEFGGTDFSDVELERAGVIHGNYKSGQLIERMTGGVRMLFLGETEKENVRVSAQEVSFEYPDDNNREPSRIFMQGDVRIRVEGNIVDSGTADFDLTAGMATFREKPVIDMNEGPKLAASLILLNLDTGDFEVHDGVRVPEPGDSEPAPEETAPAADATP